MSANWHQAGIKLGRRGRRLGEVTALSPAPLRGAGEGNRTPVASLGSSCSTIELHPRTRVDASVPHPRLPAVQLLAKVPV